MQKNIFHIPMSLFNIGPQPPGYLTAQITIHLSLLPSGPDEVHEAALRETKTLRSNLRKTACKNTTYFKI